MLPPHRPFREAPKPQVIIKKKQPQRPAEPTVILVKGERKDLKPQLQVIAGNTSGAQAH